jgi:hypothetical protein
LPAGAHCPRGKNATIGDCWKQTHAAHRKTASSWHRCWAESEEETDAMSFEELTVMAYIEEIEKATNALPPHLRGTCPPIPPDFLEMMALS